VGKLKKRRQPLPSSSSEESLEDGKGEDLTEERT
tara:strand:+ start:139 stop:240 length:102 start_codon:yes stop_codon:yes gene_type:complete